MSYQFHYILINIFKSVQNLSFHEPFQIFHSKRSYAHCMVFIPRTHKMHLIPFILL